MIAEYDELVIQLFIPPNIVENDESTSMILFSPPIIVEYSEELHIHKPLPPIIVEPWL